MDNIYYITLMSLIGFTLSVLGTRTLIFVTQKKNLVQKSNDRSLHSIPTPVGGGLAVVTSCLIVWFLLSEQISEQNAVLLISVSSLALISWLDDIRPLSPKSRLLVQVAVVTGSLYTLDPNSYVISNQLPLALDRTITGLCWLWFINLYNFMDGMDGLAGTETIIIAIGIVMIGYTVGLSNDNLSLSIILGASMTGFLLWNWSPARIFLGDVGSIPVGFLLGWLLINLAVNGAFLAALILPLYFLFDASLTITKRFLKGKKIWEAHREHLYQKAALSGLTHSQVVLRILPSNILLLYSAYISMYQPIVGIILSLISISLVVIGLFVLKNEA